MATVETRMRHTPADLLAIPDGENFKLVDGNLVELNVSVLSSLVGSTILAAILQFARERHLGLTWGTDLGLQCYPDDLDRLRRADVVFVRSERINSDLLEDSYLRIVPDLVVEVVSPHDGAYDLERKIHEFLQAGVRLVWIVHPEQHTVRIHRVDGTIGWLTDADVLDGETVLPGFRLPVRDLFPPKSETPSALVTAN